MSPRPRKVSDEQVFEAASRVMGRLGPAKVALADIAEEAGVTPGALVQRFGGKRELLLAHAARAVKETPQTFLRLRKAHPSPLRALRAYAEGIACMGETPGRLAHHLSYLQVDLTDPDFHRHTAAMARATTRALAELLREAVEAGELKAKLDCKILARSVQVTLTGSLLSWAFFRQGSAAGWVRDDLERLLEPFLTAAGRRRLSRGSHPRRR